MYQIGDIIPAYVFKRLSLYSIFFLAITVLALFSILILHKLVTEKNEKKKGGYIDKYKNLLNQYLENKDVRIKQPLNNMQYEALADVCIDKLSKNSKEMETKIKKFIKEETFLVEHYKKMVKSSSWLKRFIAIEKIGFFMLDDLKEFFTETINNDQSLEVRAKAVWALSLVADEKALNIITKKLLPEISQSSKFNEYIYTNVIRSLKKKNMAQIFITFLHDIKKDETILSLIKRDLIEACGSAGLFEAENTINEYFSDYSDDVLIKVACIRALGKIAYSGTCKAIIAGLNDKDWRVRTVSAKAASICHDFSIISQVQRLLYDPVFYVRINAAKTLAKLGENGLSALRNEVNSKDRFVRDTVRYILEETEIYA